MSDSSFFGSVPSPVISPLTTQADKFLRHPARSSDGEQQDREVSQRF